MEQLKRLAASFALLIVLAVVVVGVVFCIVTAAFFAVDHVKWLVVGAVPLLIVGGCWRCVYVEMYD